MGRVQISCDICTRFARYLYSTKQCWIINSYKSSYHTALFPGSFSSASLVAGNRPWVRLVTWPRLRRLHLSISHWSERKAISGHRFIKSHTGKYTFQILLSYSKPQVKQNIFMLHIQRIEVSLWFQFQRVEFLKLFCCFKLPELISPQFAKYMTSLCQGTVLLKIWSRWNISTRFCQQNCKSFCIALNQKVQGRILDWANRPLDRSIF